MARKNAGKYDTSETVERFSNDQLLRRWGFVIHSRAKNERPRWRLQGTIYPQEAALRLAKAWEQDNSKEPP